MSVGLNDGSRFRILDGNNKDITTTKDVNKNAEKIQIDTDKDGKFDGPADVTITDKTQIGLITDNVKGNAKALANIPFVGEIESHVVKNGPIDDLIILARDQGKLSDKTSVFSMTEKIQHGRVAFDSIEKAFNMDKSNTNARYSFAVAILKIDSSMFKSTAEDKLGINIENLYKTVIPELAKDKQDVLGQMILKKIYHTKGDPREAGVDQNLAQLKKQDPAGYEAADARIHKDFK